jgi:two-component system sensor kinase FixL
MSLPFPIPSSTLFSEEKAKTETNEITARFYRSGHEDVRPALQDRSSNFDAPKELLQKILKISPNTIIVTNAHGVVISFNNSSEQLFGYYEEEVVGKNISSLFDLDFGAERIISLLAPEDRGGWKPITTEPPLHGRKRSGELFPLDLLLNECVLGEPPTYVFLVRDMTVRVRQAQRIAELEREVAHLARHSLLGELATTITHELAQPLTAITNYTNAAGRCLAQNVEAKAEIGLELIEKAGEQAKRAWIIMHRLRKLLQHRDAEFSAGDLRQALHEAVELATLGASQHGISIVVEVPDEPVTVRMDSVQLQILLANLIRNAVDELRVCRGERKIWITMRVTEADQTEILVEDTGPGIAPEVYANIFDPFLTTKPHGLGVGLAVSRRIALAHEGRLAARNRSEGGAAFSFLMPLMKP